MASRIHHVCWCVEPDQVDAVRDLFAHTLGAEFLDLDLEPLGIRALISWDTGVEVIAPTRAQGRVAPTARAFLDEHGPGVYTVVFDVDDLRPALEAAARHGARETLREELPVLGELAARYRALDHVTLAPVGPLRLSLQQLLARPGVGSISGAGSTSGSGSGGEAIHDQHRREHEEGHGGADPDGPFG